MLSTPDDSCGSSSMCTVQVLHSHAAYSSHCCLLSSRVPSEQLFVLQTLMQPNPVLDYWVPASTKLQELGVLRLGSPWVQQRGMRCEASNGTGRVQLKQTVHTISTKLRTMVRLNRRRIQGMLQSVLGSGFLQSKHSHRQSAGGSLQVVLVRAFHAPHPFLQVGQSSAATFLQTSNLVASTSSTAGYVGTKAPPSRTRIHARQLAHWQ